MTGLLAPAVVEPAPYRLVLPASWGWLTANQRGSWAAHHATRAAWRQVSALTARSARVPALSRVYIIGELRFTSRRRRDPANWAPTAKAAVDGLVDAGVVVDDDADHVTGPDMRLGPVATDGVPTLTLHIWPLAAAP